MVEGGGPFPIHEAVTRGQLDLVKKLVNDGCDVNERHYDRSTPLHRAALSGYLDVSTFLLEKGAMINGQTIDNSTPLCEACAGGNFECVKLLLKAGAWVNPPLLMSTPLHEAAPRGNPEILRVLIEAGAKINTNDLHYGTPLMAVCCSFAPSLECVRILLQSGADVNAIKNHRTALHMLSQHSSDLEVGKLLLYYGANMYAKNREGRCARQLLDNKRCPLGALLHEYETTPRDLKQCCRLFLRKHIGVSGIKALKESGIIPLSIGDFLS